jgi:hypothetical protein
MEPIKVTLCPLCTECPEVEITDQGVTIGEDANKVRLSHTEQSTERAKIQRSRFSRPIRPNPQPVPRPRNFNSRFHRTISSAGW